MACLNNPPPITFESTFTFLFITLPKLQKNKEGLKQISSNLNPLWGTLKAQEEGEYRNIAQMQETINLQCL